MEEYAKVTYSAAIIRRAVRHFWWRTAGWKMLAASALATSSLILLLLAGDRSWLVGASGAISVVSLAFLAAFYVIRYRRGIERLTAMGDPTAELVASQTTFTIRSRAGSADLYWSSIIAIRRFPEVWLLMVSRRQYITLPTGQLAPDFLALMEERVRSSGGRIV
jgi:hypothetical protein